MKTSTEVSPAARMSRRGSSASLVNEHDLWFFPRDVVASREAAEDRLAEVNYLEGVFLVRESISAAGDYVLSVAHAGSAVHYQLRRRGQDALFSLAEETRVIHGLDELVRFYRDENARSGLQHPLSSPLAGGRPCPADVRLHGIENLLHRASSAGDVDVVSELLACGDRDLSARNRDGQTAVHLAAFYGHEQVLRALIGHGAAVNAIDSSGYTVSQSYTCIITPTLLECWSPLQPLHFCAQAGQAACARVLLGEGGASPVTRGLTGWTALHEAAWQGKAATAAAIVAGGSPVRPRTPNNETPADLARAGGHHLLADELETTLAEIGPPAALNANDFLHSRATREEAVAHLVLVGKGDGSFLLRKSRKGPHVLVLSLLHDAKTWHFEIIKQGVFYFMAQGPYMPTLEHLVAHYSRYSDGLPCALKTPVKCDGREKPPAPR